MPFYLWLRAERDLYFAKTVQSVRSTEPSSETMAEVWTVIWVSFDVRLPKRWQLSSDPGPEMERLVLVAPGELEQTIASHERSVELLRGLNSPDNKSDRREAYALANGVMKPLLARMGYCSLAQFERAYEETAGDPPWPRSV